MIVGVCDKRLSKQWLCRPLVLSQGRCVVDRKSATHQVLSFFIIFIFRENSLKVSPIFMLNSRFSLKTLELCFGAKCKSSPSRRILTTLSLPKFAFGLLSKKLIKSIKQGNQNSKQPRSCVTSKSKHINPSRILHFINHPIRGFSQTKLSMARKMTILQWENKQSDVTDLLHKYENSSKVGTRVRPNASENQLICHT